MFEFLKRRHSIDLIFIHIHKTGGKSISKALEEIYKEKHFRLNRSYLRRNNLDYLDPGNKVIPRSTEVLSGHLTHLESHRLAHKNTKWITWLRDPTDRIISHYYWRLKINNSKPEVNYPLSDPDLTIEEFIEFPDNQNWMSKFLDGIALEDFFFIGFLESFDEDLKALSKKLKWSQFPLYHINRNKDYKPDKPDIEKKIIDRIADLNRADIELYQKALSLKRSV